MVSVEYPNNSLFKNCVVLNSNIEECRILWTEEAKSEFGLFRELKLTIAQGFVGSDHGVSSSGAAAKWERKNYKQVRKK